MSPGRTKEASDVGGGKTWLGSVFWEDWDPVLWCVHVCTWVCVCMCSRGGGVCWEQPLLSQTGCLHYVTGQTRFSYTETFTCVVSSPGAFFFFFLGCIPHPSRLSGIWFIMIVLRIHSLYFPCSELQGKERWGQSPAGYISQVLSQLDSTNGRHCWALEGGRKGEARVFFHSLSASGGVSSSSCVSSRVPVSLGWPSVVPSFSGSRLAPGSHNPPSSLCLSSLGVVPASCYC